MGTPDLERSPAAYVVEYFNGFAERFDEKLVTGLHYDVPPKLSRCRLGLRGTGPVVRHARCRLRYGTLRSAPPAQPRTLVGVDLSPGMLDQARRRKVYDDLCCDDLVPFLAGSAGRFDLVVAADVFLYFGDLRPVWEAARAALRPGGLLAFSTEATAGDSYFLQPSGRFAHSTAYVRSTLASGFEEQACTETTLRQEAGQPVHGHCYIFSRR